MLPATTDDEAEPNGEGICIPKGFDWYISSYLAYINLKKKIENNKVKHQNSFCRMAIRKQKQSNKYLLLNSNLKTDMQTITSKVDKLLWNIYTPKAVTMLTAM